MNSETRFLKTAGEVEKQKFPSVPSREQVPSGSLLQPGGDKPVPSEKMPTAFRSRWEWADKENPLTMMPTSHWCQR